LIVENFLYAFAMLDAQCSIFNAQCSMLNNQ